MAFADDIKVLTTVFKKFTYRKCNVVIAQNDNIEEVSLVIETPSGVYSTYSVGMAEAFADAQQYIEENFDENGNKK